MINVPHPRSGGLRTLALDLIAVLMIAAVFRLPALQADFWFDEIYSYQRFAQRAGSVADIFLAADLRHDNNHHLNTLAIYLMGDRTNWIVYRLPGTLLGFAAVAAVVLIGRRRSRLEGLVAGTLVASSYLVVVYSTEARGYAWLLAFATSGFLALDRFLSTRARTALCVFWLSMAGGLAAHPAILHLYLGALLWSGYRLRSDRRDLVLLHAVPVTWIVLWLAFVTRGALVGGGPPWTWGRIADEAFAWTLGYPLRTVPPLLTALGVLALAVLVARRLWTRGSDEGLFYIGAILGPIVLIAALSPPYLFPRYFLVPLFFSLVMAAHGIAALARNSPTGRFVAAGIVFLFVLGNGVHLSALIRERRGALAGAVQTIARSKPGQVTVTGWSLDQWAAMPLSFYSTRLGFSDRIVYVPRGEAARTGSDWALEVTQPCSPAPPLRRSLPSSEDSYVLARSFPVCGPSGMSWFLYTREAVTPSNEQAGPTASAPQP